MQYRSIYSRDLLYPTDKLFEPGSIHVEILEIKGEKMFVVVESRTHHSPIQHIKEITTLLQSDIFSRINVDIERNVRLYIVVNDEIKNEFIPHAYVLVSFNEGNISFTGVDEIKQT